MTLRRAAWYPRRARAASYGSPRPPRVDGQPDARQWCVGTYRVKVFFKQTLQCPPPIQCGDSVAVSLGSTTFTVVAGPLPGT